MSNSEAGKITEQFLEVLTYEARRYGWTGDYEEVRRFVEYLHKKANLPVPDMNPFDDTETTSNE